METITVKELKDIIDNDGCSIDYDDYGMCIAVVGDVMQHGGFSREYKAEAWIGNLRFGLDMYRDNRVISCNDDGTSTIRSAVLTGKCWHGIGYARC